MCVKLNFHIVLARQCFRYRWYYYVAQEKHFIAVLLSLITTFTKLFPLLFQIWDVQTGKELKELTSHTAAVKCCHFSPDDSRIASCSDDMTVKVSVAKLTWMYFTGCVPLSNCLRPHLAKWQCFCARLRRHTPYQNAKKMLKMELMHLFFFVLFCLFFNLRLVLFSNLQYRLSSAADRDAFIEIIIKCIYKRLKQKSLGALQTNIENTTIIPKI